MTDEAEVDVVVVGAGPTGLLTASELALSGVGVQVIDRLAAPGPTVKAGSVNVATAEVLDRRGLLPAMRRAHQRTMQEVARFAQDLAAVALAATVRGWAPDGLLATYTAERHPIGAWVLDWTRGQVALMRGDAKTRQLREIVEQDLLGTVQGMTSVVTLTSGIAQRYTLDGGAEAAAVETGGEAGPAVVGRLAGDVRLADGSRLADHAHGGGFVLLDRRPDQAFSRLAGSWPDRVTVVSDAGKDPAGLLMRPDGVVIWAGGDEVALERALRQWAGTPARQPAVR